MPHRYKGSSLCPKLRFSYMLPKPFCTIISPFIRFRYFLLYLNTSSLCLRNIIFFEESLPPFTLCDRSGSQANCGTRTLLPLTSWSRNSLCLMNTLTLLSAYIVIIVYLDVLLVLWLFSNRSSSITEAQSPWTTPYPTVCALTMSDSTHVVSESPSVQAHLQQP